MTKNICLAITKEQHEEIHQLMQIEGYRSRSEFIRFTIKFYKYHAQRNTPPREAQEGYKWGERKWMMEEVRGD